MSTSILDHFSISFFLEYEIEISLEDKLDCLCQHIQAHIIDQGGKCSSFRDFVSFITNTSDVSRAIYSNLLELLSNNTKSTNLQMELAIIIDVFVKATYNLEGARLFSIITYGHSFLFSFATTVHYPNTSAICT